MVRHGWPYFGLTTTLNTAAYCASMSTVWAGQQRNVQVADKFTSTEVVYGVTGTDVTVFPEYGVSP